MSTHSLSVVMSNYNHGKYIARSIESVLSQSKPPDEFIIMDDGSTDNSIEIIESYAQGCPYISVVKNLKNEGIMKSYNRLFNMTIGDYIYGTSADDYVLQGFFEKAMNMAEYYPQAGIIFGKMLVTDSMGKELFVGEVEHWSQPLFASPDVFLKEYLSIQNPNHSLCSATIFKRKAFEEVGWFKPELGSWSDTFAARSIALKYGACYLAYPCASWTQWQDSFSGFSRINPKLVLDIIARSAWLMRSPEFKDRFSEAHVAWWEETYRRDVIVEHLQKIKESFDIQRKLCQTVLSNNSLIEQLIRFAFSKWIGLGRRIMTRILASVLIRYKGDISCYIGHHKK